jgi:hypothetical protein
MDKPENLSWRLEEGVDFVEAQFSLGDFCVDNFPDHPQFARLIQNAEDVAALRKEIKPIVNLIFTERKDLSEAFTTLLKQVNDTKE